MRFTSYSRAASNAAYDAAQAAWDGMSPEEFDPCPRDPEQWEEWCAKLAMTLDVICDWPAYNIQLESVTLDDMAADLLGSAYEEPPLPPIARVIRRYGPPFNACMRWNMSAFPPMPWTAT